MAPDPLTLPAIHASHIGIWLADTHGRVQRVGRGEAIAADAATPHLLLNATLTGDRLGYPELSGLDLLELFAFLYPARFAVPTPADRKSVVSGKSVSVRVDLGGRRYINKKNNSKTLTPSAINTT